MHGPNFVYKMEELALNLLQPNELKFFIQGDKILVTRSG